MWREIRYFIQDFLSDTDLLLQVAIAIFVASSIALVIGPLLVKDPLTRRLKSLNNEKLKVRERAREKMKTEGKIELRSTPKGYVQFVVERLNLKKWVEQADAREKLVQAGYRGQGPYLTFLFFRLVMPVVSFLLTLFYTFVVLKIDQPPIVLFLGSVFGAYVGMQLPMIFVRNMVDKRREAIRRVFPDALDLLLICVEAGMSVEMAFRKVSDELSGQCMAMAEEMMLTATELSYLQERRMAYDNLAKRVDLDAVKAVTTALYQAERYGTPLSQTLRVMAQESRDMRMAAAEKKAASLPPKLTVPMILFFLPCLFVVILAPAAIRFNMKSESPSATSQQQR